MGSQVESEIKLETALFFLIMKTKVMNFSFYLQEDEDFEIMYDKEGNLITKISENEKGMLCGKYLS